jgi:hypothetical protein
MAKIILVIFLLTGSLNLASCQTAGSTAEPEKKYGFSMEEPKDWLVTNKNGLTNNLGKFEFSEAEIAKLLKDQNKQVLLVAYNKYDPNLKEGLIPTIQVNVLENKTKDFSTFKGAIIRSIDQIKQYFDDYELIEEPSDVEISGIRSTFVFSKFTMKTQGGQILKVRSRTYAVPVKGHFYQLNFTDGHDGEDCSVEFEALLKTVKIPN